MTFEIDLAPRKGMDAAEIDALVARVLAEATLVEKVAMMSGHGFFASYKETGVWGAAPYRAGGGCERLNVPALWFTDGPRGVARGSSTCFPCTMARGASFDVELERRIGEAMAIEVRAQGCNLSGAVCINLLRHPAWGRAQETYGEDPCHLGEMGAALGLGLQHHNVIATAKHFALNSMENARFKVDVQVDERTLHDVYMPHFRRVLSAGVASVMSAYNKVNGDWCGHSATLLTDILRGEWGFTGFIHSDWVKGVYDVSGAVAGLDVENPEPLVWGDKLIAAVEAGEVKAEVVDRACRRILTTLYRFLAAPDPLATYTSDMVAQPAHVGLAREAAEKSAVLLKNECALPFDDSRLKRMAVLGRLAALENTGDMGSSRVRAPRVVTALAGLEARLGPGALVHADEGDLDAVRRAVAAADAVVVVAGYTAEDEGEFIPGDIDLGQEAAANDPERAHSRPPRGGDRASLDLPEAQVAMIRAAARAAEGKPLVVVLVAGSAVMVEAWIDAVPAALQTFYAGMEGGGALARLLFGDVSPSGRLPFTVARDAADYPVFDRDADAIDYGGLHGYARLEAEGRSPRFAFGHGLSYTRFTREALEVRVEAGGVAAEVTVANTGACAGAEVVQAYVAYPPGAAAPGARLLKAFARVELAAGETQRVRLHIPWEALALRQVGAGREVAPTGEYRLLIAGSAIDPHPLEAAFRL